MTNTTYIAAELAGMKVEAAILTKRVEMCSAARPHLTGCAHSQNEARIAEANDILDTLRTHIEVIERYGLEEMAEAEAAEIDFEAGR
jgi:hypothetical protein